VAWKSFLNRSTMVLLLLALGAGPVHAADEPLEIVEVRTDSFPRVVVRLKATPADGRPADLTPDQLRVVEDGEPQHSVDLFRLRNSTTPASVLLAIDVSGSMAEQDRLPRAREAAKTFVGQLRASDRAALVSFADQVILRQSFTNEKRLLTGGIDGLSPGGDTRLYDALVRAAAQVKTEPGGTGAVILLTDGEDTASASKVEEGIAQAVRAGIPVYTIGLGGEVRADVLERIAAETGGRFYHAPGSQDLARVFFLISRQLSSMYELFWLSEQRDAPGRDVPVEIAVDTPAFSGARARFSYRVPSYSRIQEVPVNLGQSLVVIPGTSPPSEEQVLVASLLAGLAVLLLYAAVFVPRVRRHLQQRLATYLGDREAPEVRARVGSALPSRRANVMPLTAASARVAGRLLPGGMLDQLRRRLIHAGLPSEKHLLIFLAVELTLFLFLIAGGLFLLRSAGSDRIGSAGSALAIAFLSLLTMVALYLPYLWLRRRIEKRRRALLRALPDALDLMAIGVSAGLSLEGAMLEVSQKWENELCRELSIVLNEIRMGGGRRQALLNLVERTQLEDLRLLVAALIQAEEVGSNISETLSTQAEQLRIRRRQLAEENARKAPVKMLVPLVFLIFPPMFVVIVGPAALAIVRTIRTISGA
jgi:tight adherence protein C